MAHQILENDITWTIDGDEPAWHRIDRRIPAQGWESPEWREPFNWSPEISRLEYLNPITGRQEANPYRALVRSDDGSLLSIVGDEAEHRSYLSTADQFRPLVDVHGYRLATGGTLRGGKTAYVTLAAPEDLTLPDGSMLRPYLALLLSQCGRADVIKHTGIRIVCANTEALALGEEAPEIKIRHTARYEQNRDLAAQLVCAAGNVAAVTVAEYQRQARHLVSMDRAVELFESIIGKAPEAPSARGRWNNRMDLFKHAYTQAPGASPGTLWGVMQAVTYVASHETGKGQDKGGAASRLLDGGAAQSLIRKGSTVVSFAMAA